MADWWAASGLVGGLRGLILWGQATQGWQTGLTAGWGAGWAPSSGLCRSIDYLGLGWAVLLVILAPFVPTAVVGAVLLVGAVLWLVMLVTRPLQLTPVTLGVMAFWGITTVAMVCSPSLGTSLYGWGLVTLYLMGYALLSRVLQRYRDAVIAVYLGVVGVVGLEGLRQWRVGAVALATWVDQDSPLKDATRIYSYLGNPNLLASYLIPAVALGAGAALVWRPWWAKVAAGSMAGLAAVCIGLTYSRGGWLALVAMGLLGLGLGLTRVPFKVRVPLVGGLATLVVAVVAVVPAIQIRLLSIFSGRGDSSNNFRITVWNTVGEMIRDHFWLGIGPGNRTFEAIYPYYQRAGFNALGAYSVPLETWVELGVIGLVLFSWLVLLIGGWALGLGLTLKTPARWWAWAGLVLTVGLMVQGLFDTVFYRPEVQILWWLGVALVNSLAVNKEA